MIKRVVNALIVSVMIGTGILAVGSQTYASEKKEDINDERNLTTYGIGEWTQEEKEYFLKLLNNVHKNINDEAPELNLCENVTWSDELEHVSKVKLEFQYETFLKNNYPPNPHVYHRRPEPYETLKPLMKGYFLDSGDSYIKGMEPPYFYLENEMFYYCNTQYGFVSVYNTLFEYLTERNNPAQDVGHATALLGAEQIGAAYNSYPDNYSSGRSAIHEVLSYKGDSFKRSCNNDKALQKYALENLFKNTEKVRELMLEEPEEELEPGWKKIDGIWYYVNENGNYVKKSWKWIEGKCYYFDKDGKMAVNTWIGNSYVNGSGVWVQGSWQSNAKGWWYSYPQGGYPENKFENIDGRTYYFGNNGYMQSGWLNIGDKWYYTDESGAILKNTWKWIGNSCYYFYGDGSMAVNTWVGNSYVNGSGAWVAGSWQSNAKGWWYEYPQGGYPENKFENIDGRTYYFGNNGYMQTGWLNIGDKWYYTDSSGAILKNTWEWIGSSCYYFYGDGSMAVNTWVGNSYVNGSGAWVA